MLESSKCIKQSRSTKDGEIPHRLVINSGLRTQCPVSTVNEVNSLEQKAVFCCTNESLRVWVGFFSPQSFASTYCSITTVPLRSGSWYQEPFLITTDAKADNPQATLISTKASLNLIKPKISCKTPQEWIYIKVSHLNKKYTRMFHPLIK